MRVASAALLLLLAAGCSPPKQTYLVDILNRTPTPLSAGLLKSDRSLEEGWDGPEHIAINAPQLASRKWGTLIPPGSSATIGPQTGTFAEGVHGVLRIYAGDLAIERLIAISRTDPLRLDVHLGPGRSAFIIEMDQGRLKATPLDQPRQ